MGWGGGGWGPAGGRRSSAGSCRRGRWGGPSLVRLVRRHVLQAKADDGPQGSLCTCQPGRGAHATMLGMQVVRKQGYREGRCWCILTPAEQVGEPASGRCDLPPGSTLAPPPSHTCRHSTSARSCSASASGCGMCSSRLPSAASLTFFSSARRPATFQDRMRACNGKQGHVRSPASAESLCRTQGKMQRRVVVRGDSQPPRRSG